MNGINKSISQLIGKRVYFDANPIIYFLEGNEQFKPVIQSLFLARQENVFEALTGDLCLAEILVKPLKDNNQLLVRQAKSLFDSHFIQLVNHNREVFELASVIRSSKNIKMPDAIHIATALHYHADVILTGDNEMAKKVSEIEVMNLNELV